MAGNKRRTSPSSLPEWVREDVRRVTPKSRLQAAYHLIEAGVQAFTEGRYRAARQKLLEAKELAPRAAVVRELLGLSSYRMRRWEEALRELRTYRRLTGDTTHLPVEMDCLRALGRRADVRRAWSELERLGGAPATLKEGRVVYGAFLLDEGEPRQAWEVTNPGRMRDDAGEEDLRQWYVAARAAAALGDKETARRIGDKIEKLASGLPGMEELREEIS